VSAKPDRGINAAFGPLPWTCDESGEVVAADGSPVISVGMWGTQTAGLTFANEKVKAIVLAAPVVKRERDDLLATLRALALEADDDGAVALTAAWALIERIEKT
jgi:hypothetical protein